MENIIILILFFVTIFNFYCIYNSSIDWDTANHLYDARLKYENKNFKSNYNLGIKFILPFIYYKFWFLIKNNIKNYRFLNISIFSISYIFFINLTNIYVEEKYLYILLIFILFNLNIFNPQTSATEFLSTLIALISYQLYFFDNNFLFFSIFLIFLLPILFKITDIFFLLPFLFEINLVFNEIYLIIFTLFFLFSILFFFKKNIINLYKKLTKYFFSRSLLKHIDFTKKNFIFLISLSVIIYYNFLNSTGFDKLILLSVLIIFFIQRGYVSYFYYPILLFNLFILIKNNNLNIENNLLLFSFFVIFVYFIINFLLNLIFKDAELSFRILHNLHFSKPKQKESEKIFFQNIKKIIDNDFYLWGSRTLCCLVTKYNQVFSDYISHNHLTYWSKNIDIKKYCEEYCLKTLPDYIIESGIIIDIGELPPKLKDKYTSIFKNEIGIIYKKI